MGLFGAKKKPPNPQPAPAPAPAPATFNRKASVPVSAEEMAKINALLKESATKETKQVLKNRKASLQPGVSKPKAEKLEGFKAMDAKEAAEKAEEVRRINEKILQSKCSAPETPDPEVQKAENLAAAKAASEAAKIAKAKAIAEAKAKAAAEEAAAEAEAAAKAAAEALGGGESADKNDSTKSNGGSGESFGSSKKHSPVASLKRAATSANVNSRNSFTRRTFTKRRSQNLDNANGSSSQGASLSPSPFRKRISEDLTPMFTRKITIRRKSADADDAAPTPSFNGKTAAERAKQRAQEKVQRQALAAEMAALEPMRIRKPPRSPLKLQAASSWMQRTTCRCSKNSESFAMR